MVILVLWAAAVMYRVTVVMYNLSEIKNEIADTNRRFTTWTQACVVKGVKVLVFVKTTDIGVYHSYMRAEMDSSDL